MREALGTVTQVDPAEDDALKTHRTDQRKGRVCHGRARRADVVLVGLALPGVAIVQVGAASRPLGQQLRVNVIGMYEQDPPVQQQHFLADIEAEVVGIDRYDDVWCYPGAAEAPRDARYGDDHQVVRMCLDPGQDIVKRRAATEQHGRLAIEGAAQRARRYLLLEQIVQLAADEGRIAQLRVVDPQDGVELLPDRGHQVAVGTEIGVDGTHRFEQRDHADRGVVGETNRLE